MLAKLESVVAPLRQSVRNNQFGIERLQKELDQKQDKIAYLVGREELLREKVNSGEISSITDLNKFMQEKGNLRLAESVGYVVS